MCLPFSQNNSAVTPSVGSQVFRGEGHYYTIFGYTLWAEPASPAVNQLHGPHPLLSGIQLFPRRTGLRRVEPFNHGDHLGTGPCVQTGHAPQQSAIRRNQKRFRVSL